MKDYACTLADPACQAFVARNYEPCVAIDPVRDLTYYDEIPNPHGF